MARSSAPDTSSGARARSGRYSAGFSRNACLCICVVLIIASACASRPRDCAWNGFEPEIANLAAANPKASAIIGGLVSSRDREPHPGMAVELHFLEEDRRLPPQVTTRSGQFAFYDVPPGVKLVLEIRDFGFVPQRSRPFTVSAGEKKAFRIELNRWHVVVITTLPSRSVYLGH